MTGPQVDLHRLVLVPLTPIHVGGGEEARLRPEDYRLRDGYAERVAIRAVLARLPEAERRTWIKTVLEAPVDKVHKFIRPQILRLQGKATAEDILERIPISEESTRALDLADDENDRRNQIDAFLRAGGRPVLPGSTVKGALRTAWAAEMARRFSGRFDRLPPMGAWKALTPKERAEQASKLMEQLLALAPGGAAQDSDPFRDLTVSDAPLCEGATRIDKVHSWKRLPPVADGRPGPYDFASVGEMHRERLRAVADGGPPPVIALTLGLRTAAVRKEAARHDRSKRPSDSRTTHSLDELLAALEAQHAPLWRREVDEKFFAGEAGQRLREALGLFADVRRDGPAPEAALIRLGWAGHAEAKSLAGLRRIERPQALGEGRIADEGSARHVVDLAGHPLPFGWALVIRAEAWAARAPAAWLAAPARRAAPAAGPARGAAPAGPRAASALGRQLRYARGQRVTVGGATGRLLDDVTAAARPDDTVRVEFDGDIETVKVREIGGSA